MVQQQSASLSGIYTELSSALKRAGFETQPVKDGSLPVTFGGEPLRKVVGDGIRYFPDDINTFEKETARDSVSTIATTDTYGDAFRINIESSDPKYSFGYSGDSATTLYVFEAPIDLLSFLTLYPVDWQKQSYVSLCGTSEHAMLHALERNSNLQTVTLCLDNDNAGFIAKVRLKGILHEHDYTNINELTPKRKDWNDVLCAKAEILEAAEAAERRSMSQTT